MYERNAIVIERHFARLFGYDEKNNIKNNYKNYCDLVNQIEEYQNSTEKEDKIISEYDEIIGKIKDIQKKQDTLYKKNEKLQESRNTIFENIDENVEGLKKKLDKIEEEIKNNNEEMKANGENFIVELNEFNEKSINRNQCSRNRRIVESNYQKKLKETITNLNNIKAEKVTEIKNFFKSENNVQEDIKEEVLKNGEKERIPFSIEVIEKAINMETDIAEKETEIYCTVFDRTHRLLVEIKNDSIKLDKHKKLIRDSECKLNFLNAMKEYLTLFLDNERLNILGGEKEHKKLMSDACKNLEDDIIQIKNLYSIITKEASGKSTKKMYKDLYDIEYLYRLEEEEKLFENNISKLNVIGTVIYPDYWRLEGMQKIFSSFKNSIENVYEKDLSEYEPIVPYKEADETKSDIVNEQNEEEKFDIQKIMEQIEEDDIKTEEPEEMEEVEEKKDDSQEEKNEETEEKDREIDEILGFYNFDSNIDDDDIDEDLDDDELEDNEVDEAEDEEDEDDDILSDEEEEDEDEDYEYGFDEEDDGYDDIDFDDDDDETETLSYKSKK